MVDERKAALLLDPGVPVEVWARSGRPARGTLFRAFLAVFIASVGIAIGTPLAIAGGIALGLVGFLAVPMLTASRLQGLTDELRDVTASVARARWREMERARLVTLFAPHAWVALQRARVLLQEGDGRGAASEIAEAGRLSREPRHPSILRAQARAFVLSGDRAQARDILVGLEERKELDARAHLDLGIILLPEANRAAHARMHLERAREQLGDHPQLLASLAVLAARRGGGEEPSEWVAQAEREAAADDRIAADLIKRARKDLRPGGGKRDRRAAAVAPAPKRDKRQERRERRKRKAERDGAEAPAAAAESRDAVEPATARAEMAAEERAEAERAGAERAAEEKAAAEKVAAEKVAAEKVAAEKVAAEKVAAEKATAEKAAAERAAAEKAAAEKATAEKAAAERAAAEKAAAEKATAEKAAAEKAAAEKAAAEKVAAEKAAAEKAAEKATAERAAAEKAAAEKAVAEKAAAERAAAEKAAAEKAAAEKAAAERAAAEKAAAEAPLDRTGTADAAVTRAAGNPGTAPSPASPTFAPPPARAPAAPVLAPPVVVPAAAPPRVQGSPAAPASTDDGWGDLLDDDDAKRG